MPDLLTARQVTFAAIDFESAGVSKGETEIPIQIGIVVMQGLNANKLQSFVSYLHTDRPVTWQASQVHGITTGHLADAPTLLSLWPTIKSQLGGCHVVAHGAGTEKRYLRAAFPMHGFGPWIDTLPLARRLWPGLRDYSLSTLIAAGSLQAELDGLCPDRRFHDALYDATATLLVLRHLLLEAGLADIPLQHWHGDGAQL